LALNGWLISIAHKVGKAVEEFIPASMVIGSAAEDLQ
jgi:hypothetical protein